MAFVSGFGGFQEEQSKFETRYGSTIETDERLTLMRERESFMLNVVIPRQRTLVDAFADWKKRSQRPEIYWSMLTIAAIYFATTAGCGLYSEEGGICEAGPTDANDGALAYLSFGEDYGPPILNSLATLMLSFYANTCLGLYKEAYIACQTMKAAVIDLMMIVGGTVHPHSEDMRQSRRGVRMEFWRCVNLFHVCTYVLADKTRNSYNFDNFLVPVATAFGDYDGDERLGMLRREELSLLVRTTLAAPAAAPTSSTGDDAKPAAGPSFSNSRGDVRSKTAALHSALGVRLYALTDFVLDQKLSRAAWPAWNQLLTQVLRASEGMKQRALFRLPRIYRYAVRYLIGSAIVTDTFILGARAGRLLLYASSHPDWLTFAWFGASALLVINLLVAYFVLLLVQGLSNMEQPFDQDLNSMPGLSYVCAAAEMSLRTVACEPAGAAPARRGALDPAEEGSRPINIMSLLQHLDEVQLVHDTTDVQPAREPTMQPRVRRRDAPASAPAPAASQYASTEHQLSATLSTSSALAAGSNAPFQV